MSRNHPTINDDISELNEILGETWRPFISGICVGDPLQDTNTDIDMRTLPDTKSFTAFLSARCRGYVLSNEELGTRHSGYRVHGCNCYSSGESCYTECIIPSAWRDMLHWFDMLYENPAYEEQIVIIGRDLDEKTQEGLEKLYVGSDEDIEGKTTHDVQIDSNDGHGDNGENGKSEHNQNVAGASDIKGKGLGCLDEITEQDEDQVGEQQTI